MIKVFIQRKEDFKNNLSNITMKIKRIVNRLLD